MNIAHRFCTAALAALVFLAGGLVAADKAEPLDALRDAAEAAKNALPEDTVLPVAVNPANAVSDPALICPDGAVWYLTVPDTARLIADWTASPPGALTNENSMKFMFRNNRFGLPNLFGDLPDSVISVDRVAAVAAAMELSQTLAGMSRKMAMAGYIGADGAFSYLFLFDVGLERVPAFEKMAEWETSFFLTNPVADVVRGDHSGNFLDVWKLKKSNENMRGGEIAAGFAENVVVVSNDPDIAATCLSLLRGGRNVASSRWGGRLASSLAASATADAMGFVRMDGLLDGLRHTPIARNAVSEWADFIGHGGGDGEAMYYGLQFTDDGTRETFLLPLAGDSGTMSLVELLAKRLKKVDRWVAPQVIPYQPNPAMFIGAMLEGRQLGTLLQQDGRLFGMSNEESFKLPDGIRALFSHELVDSLTGEVGLARFPGGETGAGSWMLVLPCTRNPTSLLKKTAVTADRNGATIYSGSTEWRTSPSWTVASADTFRRLNDHFLLIASDGDTLIATLDQLVGGSSFSANKDFARAIAQAEANQGLVMYVNFPEVLVRVYPNLSHVMRLLYPRSSGLNSRPPLAMLRRYAKGMLAVIAPANGGGNDFIRVTVQSPLPSLGLMAAGIVLRFPSSLRSDGRQDMAKSMENLKELWLRLQLYSSRFGHFPDSLDDLTAELRVSLADDEIRALTTAPAALSRLTPAQASRRSYRYLSGVTPSDEPDVPVIYEAEPWSQDFSGMFPSDPSRGPSESGDYLEYRQLILLDGTPVVVTEKRFQDKILPRLQERE